MFIHNKKKKFVLSIVNILVELLCLPKKLFSAKKDFLNIVPRKILLVRLDHIGDVIMTSPSFSRLRERFPESKILLLTNNAGKQLFSNDYRIDEVFVFNWPWAQQRIKEKFSFSKIRQLIRLILKLRKEKIDLLVDFRGDLRFIILFGALTGARVKISNSRSGKSSLLDHTSKYDVSKHEVERSLDVIECFVNTSSQVRPEIYLQNSEILGIRKLFEEKTNISFPEKIAIIAPYSSRDVKSWPDAHFKQVISYLRSQNFSVIVVGTREDIPNAEELIGAFEDQVYSFAGITSVRELAALISISALVVGVDTGVLHIAACFDIPVVAIFGPTRSIEFRPYSPYAHLVQTNTCSCNQFMHVKCDCPVGGYASCLYNLMPAMVIGTISDIITSDRVLNSVN